MGLARCPDPRFVRSSHRWSMVLCAVSSRWCASVSCRCQVIVVKPLRGVFPLGPRL